MKTTIEIPDDLLKEVKLQAVREGRKLKDAVADLLRKGLDVGAKSGPAVIARSPKTNLPTVMGGDPARAGSELTPQQVAELLLGQEAGWHDEARR